jgi:hypothetical protein
MTDLTLRVQPPASVQRVEPAAFSMAATLWVAALWLMCRPFRGVRHDSLLYIGQTFNSIWPGQLSNDWFFLSTAQDRYTVFSPLMARAIAAVGLQTAEISLLLAFNALFLWAAWLLLKDLPSTLLRWAALVALATLSHTYGGEGAFAFAEPFLDARTLAEPFGLLALALLLRGRLAWSLLALAASAACHPLVTLPVIVVGWLHLCLGDRRWLWLGLLAVVPPLLGLAHVGPFGALFESFDPAWFHQVRTVDSQCFLADWGVLDWAAVVLDLALVVQACRLLPGTRTARLGMATVIGSLLLTVLWGLGADVAHNVLLTQLQLWRVYWLLHFLALCLLPVILGHYMREGPLGQWLVAAVILACVAVQSNWDTGWVCCVWLAVVFVAVKRRVRLARGILRLATFGTLAVSLLISAFVFSKTTEAVAESGSFGDTSWLSIAFSLLVVSASVGFGSLAALKSSNPVARAAAGALAVAVLMFGIRAWDQRSPWQSYTERAYASEGRPFAGQIPPGASVFWEDNPLQTWLLLHRPSYFSLNQASGLVFSRAASMEFARRNEPFKALMYQRQACARQLAMQEQGRLPQGPLDCVRPAVAVMKKICNIPGGGPDYMIFESRRPEGLVSSWKFEEGPPSSQTTYYLYDCSRLH